MTDGQMLHRQYLCSPVWKAKRQEALGFYGCICNRCEESGSDVHHKTYARVGGNELMEDLEVLCRDCHKAHHRANAHTGKWTRTGINRQAIFRYLSDEQKSKIVAKYELDSVHDLYVKILSDTFYAYASALIIGYKSVYEVRISDDKTGGVFKQYNKSTRPRSNLAKVNVGVQFSVAAPLYASVPLVAKGRDF